MVDTKEEELQKAVKAGMKMRLRVGFGPSIAYEYFCWVMSWLGEGNLCAKYIDEFSNQFTSSTHIQLAKQSLVVAKGEKISAEKALGILVNTYLAFRNGRFIKRCRWETDVKEITEMITNKMEAIA